MITANQARIISQVANSPKDVEMFLSEIERRIDEAANAGRRGVGNAFHGLKVNQVTQELIVKTLRDNCYEVIEHGTLVVIKW